MATKKVVAKKIVAKKEEKPKGLTYAQAKKALDAEQKVTRPSFGEGAFIFHGQPFVEIGFVVNEITQQVNASAHHNIPYKSGGILCKKTDVIEVGWQPTKEDLKAEDWEIVN